MRRLLRAELPQPNWPPDTSVRTIVPGQDDEAWLALNARAFADHPEQGGFGRDDLERRMREPWFDPAGFFLAYRLGEGGEHLVGFHWTKVHGGGSHPQPDDQQPGDGHHEERNHGHDPIGEVYVLGVDPGAQGDGLGRALTLTGLHYLRRRGLPQVLLYVEADNTAAIAVYQALGFTRWDTDVMYRVG